MVGSRFILALASTIGLGLIARVNAVSVSGTALVVGTDSASAKAAAVAFKAYGIPYQTYATKAGGSLPALNSSATVGNYGVIVVADQALTGDALKPIYAYQEAFGVRLVRLNAEPGADSGTEYATAGAACCDTGVEQFINIKNDTGFAAAGIKKNVDISSQDLWHIPANIVNTTNTWQVASYGSNKNFKSNSTAAVINQFGSRQQMVWFLPFSPDWSPTSALLMHTWLQWGTRGIYAGYRRMALNTQIDDVFLITELFSPKTGTYRVIPDDLDSHKTWTSTMNSKFPTGSNYIIELGHNGNGNIELNDQYGNDRDHVQTCKPGSIEYADQPDETAATIEFKKPLGTGTSIWPKTPTKYGYSEDCVTYDELAVWFQDSDNLNGFAHISHTFTHMDLNNATYDDTVKEIQFNQAWLKAMGITSATKWSPKGLIPPAITGIHNGDSIRAWMENGLTGVVGDNTRSSLLNADNEYWPQTSTMDQNGHDGLIIMPRYATDMNYNCDTQACNLALWKNVSKPDGTWDQLMAQIKTQTRNLFALRQDAYMFHQANLRLEGITSSTVYGVKGTRSLLQIWVEQVMLEVIRLVTWPVITYKHDDLVQRFVDRRTRDQCNYQVQYTYDDAKTKIVSLTLSAKDLSCKAAIPLTFPSTVAGTGGTKEQIGKDSPTYWVTLAGAAKTITLDTPVGLLSD